ncbi:RNA polymerase sigma factor [Streptomyces sp. NPDC058475]|uniref:RNA polymerase sigma factor n=1 Tax=Streptomyces sp. NPDC058475 TaxID=3346518 RepID=UPI003665A409
MTTGRPTGEVVDAAGFEAFFGKTLGPLINYLVRQGASVPDAQDAAQEALAGLWGHWDKVKSPTAWSYTAARRIWLKNTVANSRNLNVEPASVLDEVVDPSDPATFVQEAQEAVEIVNLISQLPDTQRAVFTLYLLYGGRHQEIAEQLGLTEATTRSHLRHGRRRLAELLAKRQAQEADSPS